MGQPASKKARHTATSRAKRKAFKAGRVRCAYCGKGLSPQTATGDHKQPIALGGSNKSKNIAMACRDCNGRKGAMAHGTFIALLRSEGRA